MSTKKTTQKKKDMPQTNNSQIKIKKLEKDDDCVCSGSKQNPLVPVFWGIVVILFGLWIVFSFIIPRSYLPAGL